MTLDRWFGRDITNHTRPGEKSSCFSSGPSDPEMLTPPPSSQPDEEEEIEYKKPLPRRIARTDQRIARLGPLSRHLSRIGSHVPMELYNNCEMEMFKETKATNLGIVPYAISSSNKLGWSFIGLQNGDIRIIDLSSERRGDFVGEIPARHPAIVRDLDVVEDQMLLSCSDASVLQIDLKTEQLVGTYTPRDDVGFRQVKGGCRRELFLTSTQGGSIYVLDRRDNNPAKTISDAHTATAPRSRSRKSMKISHAVTSAVWVNDHVIASACTQNQTVKYWDLRNTRTPANTVEASNPFEDAASRSYSGGIASLVRDEDQRIWALTKQGHVASTTLEYSNVLDCLTSPHLSVPSYYTRMDYVSSPNLSGTYLACGGEHGLTILNLPALRSSLMGISVQDSRLLTGHTIATTAIHWNSSQDALVSLGDDMHCRFTSICT